MCKRLTPEQIAQLKQPLPAKALRPHPSKSFLTTINSIYVTERLNDVFGIGSWQLSSEIVDNSGKMVIVKTHLVIPEYGISYECFGGNDNADKGDAHKGAVTDAITKIGSWLGIGAEVWKNEAGKAQQTPATQPVSTTAPQQTNRKVVNDALLDNRERQQKLIAWLKAEMGKQGADMMSFSPILHLKDNGYTFEDSADRRLADIWYMELNKDKSNG